MKTNIFFAATVAHLASAQGVLDIQQVVDAPAVTATAPPQVKVVDYAAVEASLAAVLTASTAKTTGAPGKFRMKREPEADPTIGSWNVKYHLDSKFCRTFWFKPSCEYPSQRSQVRVTDVHDRPKIQPAIIPSAAVSQITVLKARSGTQAIFEAASAIL
jgi:hypothetical protein